MKTCCWLFLLASVLGVPFATAAKTKTPTPIENRSFEKGGVFPEIYRDDFAQTLRKYPNGRFARACRGERIAMQRYFRRALDTSLDGQRSDALGYVLVKIMFRVGDARFARALRGGEVSIRQAVGSNIDPLIVRHHLSFPKTRACYRFRAQEDE